jgi:MATE family multidrug resistance protein
LNRGRAVLLIFFLPISMVLLYSSKILIFLGQDMEVSYLTGAYIFHLIPGILFMALFDANRTFLNAMNYTIVPTACYCLAVPLHILSAYLLVEILKYEVMGICYALNITYFSLFIFLHVYTSKIDSIKEAWFYPKLDDIFNQTDLYEYLKLGLPGALMMMINYLGCQLMALFAGYIGLNEQAAMVLFRINKKILLINFTTLIFMFPYGISLAACVLVGNSVGRND